MVLTSRLTAKEAVTGTKISATLANLVQVSSELSTLVFNQCISLTKMFNK